MSAARKRRRYLRWLRYCRHIHWQVKHIHQTDRSGHARAAEALYRVAPGQQIWLWVELS